MELLLAKAQDASEKLLPKIVELLPRLGDLENVGADLLMSAVMRTISTITGRLCFMC